jgi:hypothetical protein
LRIRATWGRSAGAARSAAKAIAARSGKPRLNVNLSGASHWAKRPAGRLILQLFFKPGPAGGR